MFTILHISDLHRSPTDPIENSTLLGSLLSDLDRYKVESARLTNGRDRRSLACAPGA